MPTYTIELTLLTETTFGRGDGVAGLVDEEVQHDPQGFPYLAGRTLKGLLQECCADIFYTVGKIGNGAVHDAVADSALFLFGRPGALLAGGQAALHFGHATISPALREAVSVLGLSAQTVLEAFTTLRRQTQIDADGVAKEASLRTARVILRDTVFYAPLTFERQPSPHDLALLAACVAALRQVGSSRNRGSGWVQAKLLADGQAISTQQLDVFEKWVNA
jgi:CRISPR/Cas system CSM-associated protein Csm3 (group 7 of RAMP superfamily)